MMTVMITRNLRPASLPERCPSALSGVLLNRRVILF